jgi:hypothetical protein
MKFKKFVKSLASSGIIYEHGVFKERWLASPSAFMLIPAGTRSVTSAGISDMPENIGKMIEQIGNTQLATLTKAVMPYADGAIKDCVRIFTVSSGDISIAISNDDWSLIEKSDFCEILYAYDDNENAFVAKALLVKNYPQMPDDDDLLVGIIFPVDYENKEEEHNG